MEGVQHNTYDVEFYGPNPLCGVYYLGALRAAEEMARALGDSSAAQEYRALFEKGRSWVDSNLLTANITFRCSQHSERTRSLALRLETWEPIIRNHLNFSSAKGAWRIN